MPFTVLSVLGRKASFTPVAVWSLVTKMVCGRAVGGQTGFYVIPSGIAAITMKSLRVYRREGRFKPC